MTRDQDVEIRRLRELLTYALHYVVNDCASDDNMVARINSALGATPPTKPEQAITRQEAEQQIAAIINAYMRQSGNYVASVDVHVDTLYATKITDPPGSGVELGVTLVLMPDDML